MLIQTALMMLLTLQSPQTFSNREVYPAEALRLRQEGRVIAQLMISAEGNVTACKVIVSSNSESLDAKTCEIAIQRARFKPAQDSEGQPVASTFDFKLTWRLED